MKKNNLLRYWPLTLTLAGIALFAIFVVSSTPAQAIAGNQGLTLQETPPVVTVPVATIIIPESGGGESLMESFFSNWVLWSVLGLLVMVLLIALIARPRGPDIHHHHDL